MRIILVEVWQKERDTGNAVSEIIKILSINNDKKIEQLSRIIENLRAHNITVGEAEEAIEYLDIPSQTSEGAE
ncbi:hypothetical protein A2999_01825 [Candidatus Wolfebacteria bacterium RIFCSPLOWO2_01_FULL_38_11]|uniref:Uncharacterized protein n=2 Tax=Candidatus Wolfeibacteriota TaxID=1752735 RepID=A0A0G0FYY9_9BACT|nr:MAG: hypothetical protein US36_C0005G0013 [Candidatus Wolfebacteria bacterium GW2011_GWC1_37_10]OGM90682.1 MAG: hypothetical protein A2999_01825 [Candidatus Wolfebacteria bacterium RIFCSPLOWO2_01_FULL_38_11]